MTNYDYQTIVKENARLRRKNRILSVYVIWSVIVMLYNMLAQ